MISHLKNSLAAAEADSDWQLFNEEIDKLETQIDKLETQLAPAKGNAKISNGEEVGQIRVALEEARSKGKVSKEKNDTLEAQLAAAKEDGKASNKMIANLETELTAVKEDANNLWEKIVNFETGPPVAEEDADSVAICVGFKLD
ncbi:expressed unknown protein [Seminavis robusta]|uniref:Uncharacterized protein n=1 Tax=Seminavis robusta TaxID=568900 RepID=A0A9N8ECU6_9STRA|nr:expressed unknown protein [Seminavis robusta]|eukprot:Sro766_g199300.1 n/a (144) ;mRNA; r:13008-13890